MSVEITITEVNPNDFIWRCSCDSNAGLMQHYQRTEEAYAVARKHALVRHPRDNDLTVYAEFPDVPADPMEQLT